MSQKAWLCCPTPARNGNYPHAVPVSPDGPNPNHDYEVVTRCDPDTDAQILIQYDVSVSPPAAVAMIDLTTGEAWTGDVTALQACGGTSAESDPVLMCDGGVEFLRHYVKKDGEPTGVKFDTKPDGTAYTVTAEANVKMGECALPRADVSLQDCDDLTYGYGYSAVAAPFVGATVAIEDCNGGVLCYILPTADAAHTVAIRTGCGTVDTVIGYAAASNGSATGGGDGSSVTSAIMCDAGNTFVRHYRHEAGAVVGKTDTTLAGAAYTVTDEAGVSAGTCTSASASAMDISSVTADDLIGLRPGHSISVQKGVCCSLKVTTSAGEFLVAKDVPGYSIGGFKGLVTVTAVEVVSGTGNLADIIITVQKLE